MMFFSAIEMSSYCKKTRLIVISHCGRVILKATFPDLRSHKQSLRIIEGIAKEMGFPSILAWNPKDPWPSPPRNSRKIIPVPIEDSDNDAYELDYHGCEHCSPGSYHSLKRMALIAALKYAFTGKYYDKEEDPVPYWVTSKRTNSSLNDDGKIP